MGEPRTSAFHSAQSFRGSLSFLGKRTCRLGNRDLSRCPLSGSAIWPLNVRAEREADMDALRGAKTVSGYLR